MPSRSPHSKGLPNALLKNLEVSYYKPFSPLLTSGDWNDRACHTANHSRNPWEIISLDTIDGHERLIFHKPAERYDAPALLITSGIHGDEPAGPLACLQLLDSSAFRDIEVMMIATINPVGLARGTRGNGANHDLNRDFALQTTQEIRTLTEFYQMAGRFSAIISLHEDVHDYQGESGAYFYELNQDDGPACTEELKIAVEAVMRRNTQPVIDGLHAVDGVIKRRGLDPESVPVPLMTEGLMMRELGMSDLVYVMETPSTFDLETRIQTHRVAVETLARNLPVIRPKLGPRTMAMRA